MKQHFDLENNQIFALVESAGGMYQADQLQKMLLVLQDETPFFKLTTDERIGFIADKDKFENISKKLQECGMLVRAYKSDHLPSPKACLGAACPRHHEDALSDSLETAAFFEKHFMDPIVPISLGISGCEVACAQSATDDFHIVADTSGYKISIGGRPQELPQLANFLIENVQSKDLPKILTSLIDVYLTHRNENESLFDLIERIGLTPFLESCESVVPTQSPRAGSNFITKDEDANQNSESDGDSSFDSHVFSSTEEKDSEEICTEADEFSSLHSADDILLNENALLETDTNLTEFSGSLSAISLEESEQTDDFKSQDLVTLEADDPVEFEGMAELGGVGIPEDTERVFVSEYSEVNSEKSEDKEQSKQVVLNSQDSKYNQDSSFLEEDMNTGENEATKEDLDRITFAMRSEINDDTAENNDLLLPLETEESTMHHTPTQNFNSNVSVLSFEEKVSDKNHGLTEVKDAVFAETNNVAHLPANNFSGCSIKLNRKGNAIEVTLSSGVSLSIKPESLPQNGLRIEIENQILEVQKSKAGFAINSDGIVLQIPHEHDDSDSQNRGTNFRAAG